MAPLPNGFCAMYVGHCIFCQKPFKARRGKKFCSDMCRSLHWQQQLKNSDAVPVACVYCGAPAQSIDHVPPRDARPFIAEFDLLTKFPYVEVDACGECNSALGNRALWTIKERKTFIKQYLKRKYSRYLKLPEWEDCEISELGYNLKIEVSRAKAIKGWLLKRINW